MAIDAQYASSKEGIEAGVILAEVIKLMERQSVSQSELARLSGYRQSYISMLVNAKTTIQLSTALHLAHTLGLIKFVERDRD